jgi:hypothetical protein
LKPLPEDREAARDLSQPFRIIYSFGSLIAAATLTVILALTFCLNTHDFEPRLVARGMKILNV